MRTLSIDIETYSSIELTRSGVYRYVEAPDFTILLFAYAFDDEPVEVVDLTHERLSEELEAALINPEIIKTAFNANFERTCLSKYLGKHLPVKQWECTMVHSYMIGLPGSLEMVAKVLNLEAQKGAGKPLINYFLKPCKPTKVNGERMRNLPEHSPEKWEEFKAYCKQDVEVERAIKKKVSLYVIPEFEKKLWCLDQEINDRGMRVDTDMIRHAINCDAHSTEKLTAAAKSLTGLENPNSPTQIKSWIEKETGQKIKSLNKDAVQDLINTTTDQKVKDVLRLRVQMSKTSVAKYQAMKRSICKDQGLRGMIQYYGANRTGRWAGRNAQVHNLPKNHIPDLDLARRVLTSGDYEMLGLLYESTGDTLSQLVRTAFVASPGNRFIVADFSAIEARVIAWLAGEKWRIDVFNSHGKIYEASAAQMFRVPIESVTKESPLRQKGKVAELALGYQGGSGALIRMDALESGLTEDELPELVYSWRQASPKIVRLWKTVEAAAIKAVEDKTVVEIQHGVKFIYEKGILFIQLPSKRRLSYLKASIGEGSKFGNKIITYGGVNQESKKWATEETYGGKLVENVIQAIARDCLAEALIAVADAGYDIVAHVHDEIFIDAPYKEGDVKEINAIMSQSPAWAPGLPLTADAYECVYYRKD